MLRTLHSMPTAAAIVTSRSGPSVPLDGAGNQRRLSQPPVTINKGLMVARRQ
jgi:hypothetical protein